MSSARSEDPRADSWPDLVVKFQVPDTPLDFDAVMTGFIHMAESECLKPDFTRFMLLGFLPTYTLF